MKLNRQKTLRLDIVAVRRSTHRSRNCCLVYVFKKAGLCGLAHNHLVLNVWATNLLEVSPVERAKKPYTEKSSRLW